MKPRGLKMLLEEMESNIQEIKDIADKVQNGELTSKDSLEIEEKLVIDTFSIRTKVNIISKYIAYFVDNLKWFT